MSSSKKGKDDSIVEEKECGEEEFHVDPNKVSGVVDYNKLLKMFGCDQVTPEMLVRFNKLTGQKPHAMIRRGLYYAHRDFDKILDCYEKGEPFYLYTGRGPSSESMHLGHMIPFIINKHLQDAFNVPLVIQITDDEKFFWKNLTLEQATHLGRENAKDIVAFGFDLKKTFIFLDTKYIGHLFPNICKVQNKVTYNQLKSIFGFKESESESTICGKIAYPAIQAVPAFASSFKIPFDNKQLKCLIPCAIDQDPYFRLTRDVAPKLNEHKCATLYSKFIPGLQGPKGKMSASSQNGSIYLNDTEDVIRSKIMNYAWTDGTLSNDVAYQYLTFFMESDEKLNEIETKFNKGELNSQHIKKMLCDELVPIILDFQSKRKLVDDKMLDDFMKVRKLEF